MKLHRTSGKPDWETVESSHYSIFQRIATRTRGIITPANLVTLVGLGMVIAGLIAMTQGQSWLGLILVVGGRILDVADGIVAEATGTKSPIGELFDAAADKLATILTITVLAVSGIVDWLPLIILVIPQILIPLVILYKRRHGTHVHPTHQGKLSMACVWVGIVGLIAVQVFGGNYVLAIATYIIIGVAVLLGLYALWQYGTNRD